MNLHKEFGICYMYSTSERQLCHSCMLRSGAVAYVQANFATQFMGVVSRSATVREDMFVNFRVCAGTNVHNLQTTGQLTTITSYSKLHIFSFPLSAVTANSLHGFSVFHVHICPSLELLAWRMEWVRHVECTRNA